MFQRVWQEVKISRRSLLQTPLFCLAAILVLALGAACTTTIYSILQATLLKPLPYSAPSRIVGLSNSSLANNIRNIGLSPAEYIDVKASVPALSDLAYSTDQTYTMTGQGEAQTVIGYQLSQNFLPLLGVQPLFGRNFAADAAAGQNSQEVLLSYEFWQARFAGSRSVLGQTITLDGAPYTVIGVMRREFQHPTSGTDVWTPMRLDAGAAGVRNLRYLHVIGRLAPSARIRVLQEQLTVLAQRLRNLYPGSNAGWTLVAVPIRDTYVGDIRIPLLVLQGGACFLLLIACTNLANFLCARTIARKKQFAIRITLGGGSSSVFLAIVVEAFLLSLVGAALGFWLAKWCLSSVPRMMPAGVANLAIPSLQDIPLNWWSLILSLVIGLTFGIIFAILPIWRPLRDSSVGDSLAEASRRGSPRVTRSPIRSALIAAEIALSLLLLVGSGLMLRTMLRLTDRKLGFDPHNVLTMFVFLPTNRYNTPPTVSRFLDESLPSIRRIPGVAATGAVSILPLSGMATRRTFEFQGVPLASRGQQQADFRVVSPDYFQTLSIRLLQGRYFNERDRTATLPVALISESLARLLPSNVNPIGSTIIVADLGTPEPRQVIGIVGDVRDEGLAADPRPTIYRPFHQAFCPIVSFAVRFHPAISPNISKDVANVIWKADRDLPVNHIATMDHLLAASLALRRLILAILAVFAATGVLLAIIGLYGIITWDVNQRRHEIGIRLALGARKRQILWLVIRRVTGLLILGELVGIAASLVMARGLSALLFAIRPTDFVTYLGAAALLAMVSLCASLGPSIEAVGIDPADVLRME